MGFHRRRPHPGRRPCWRGLRRNRIPPARRPPLGGRVDAQHFLPLDRLQLLRRRHHLARAGQLFAKHDFPPARLARHLVPRAGAVRAVPGEPDRLRQRPLRPLQQFPRPLERYRHRQRALPELRQLGRAGHTAAGLQRHPVDQLDHRRQSRTESRNLALENLRPGGDARPRRLAAGAWRRYESGGGLLRYRLEQFDLATRRRHGAFALLQLARLLRARMRPRWRAQRERPVELGEFLLCQRRPRKVQGL